MPIQFTTTNDSFVGSPPSDVDFYFGLWLFRAFLSLLNDSTLTALTKAGEAILKCAQLIPDIQMEIDEHTGGDDGDHEGVLKVAIEK